MKTPFSALTFGLRSLFLAAFVSLVPAAVGAPPVITSVTSTLGVVNNAFTYQIEASGTPTSYAATGLPAGLSVNPATGLISGTAATSGRFDVELSATNADGTDTAPLSLAMGTISTFSADSRIGAPADLTFDKAGNLIVSNFTDSTVVKITPTGLVSVLAFGIPNPWGLAYDRKGNLYVAGGDGNIHKVSATGAVSIYATGFNSPHGLAIDSADNLYVANFGGNTVSKVTPTGVVSTFATVDPVEHPNGLTFDADGNLFIASYRPIDLSSVIKVTPDGTATRIADAAFAGDLVFDRAGTLYVSNRGPTPISGFITKVSPSGLVSQLAEGFAGSTPLAIDREDALYLVSAGGISRIAVPSAPVIASDASTRAVLNYAFSFQIEALGSPTQFTAVGLPAGLSLDAATGLITGKPTESGAFSIAISATNTVGTGTATLTLSVGTLVPFALDPLLSSLSDLTFDPAGNLVASSTSGSILKVTPTGAVSVFASGLDRPVGLAYDTCGNLYVTSYQPNGYINKISPLGEVSVFVQGLESPYDLAFDGAGNLFVSKLDDRAPGLISKITPAGVVSPFASGPDWPDPVSGISFDHAGNLYALSLATIGDSRLIKIDPNGCPSLYASGFSFPTQLALDCESGVYVADSIDGVRIQRVATTGFVGAFADNRDGLSPQLGNALVFDRGGDLYVEIAGGVGRVSFPLPPPVITSPTCATGTVGKPFHYTITATNCPTEFAAEGLPCGLTLNATTGVITGTPKQAGSFSVDLAAANDDGTGFAVLDLKIAPPADCAPPVIAKLKATPCVLWPANHKLVSVTVSAKVTDNVGVTSFKITKVTSSEADKHQGDGDVANDIQITGNLTVNLRAERSSHGNGRTYMITVEARDAAGNKTAKTITVFVPKNQGGKNCK